MLTSTRTICDLINLIPHIWHTSCELVSTIFSEGQNNLNTNKRNKPLSVWSITGLTILGILNVCLCIPVRQKQYTIFLKEKTWWNLMLLNIIDIFHMHIICLQMLTPSNFHCNISKPDETVTFCSIRLNPGYISFLSFAKTIDLTEHWT